MCVQVCLNCVFRWRPFPIHFDRVYMQWNPISIRQPCSGVERRNSVELQYTNIFHTWALLNNGLMGSCVIVFHSLLYIIGYRFLDKVQVSFLPLKTPFKLRQAYIIAILNTSIKLNTMRYDNQWYHWSNMRCWSLQKYITGVPYYSNCDTL